jgi:hypothetical protein
MSSSLRAATKGVPTPHLASGAETLGSLRAPTLLYAAAKLKPKRATGAYTRPASRSVRRRTKGNWRLQKSAPWSSIRTPPFEPRREFRRLNQ